MARINTVLWIYVRLGLFSMLVIGTILVGSYYYLNLQHQKAEDTVRLDKERVADLEPYHIEAQQLSSTVNTVAAIMNNEFIFSDMLKHIGTLMPRGAALTGLELSSEDLEAPLIVRAQVDSEQRAIVLLNNLEQSDRFERAQIRTIQRASGEEGAGQSSGGRYRYIATLDVYLKQTETKR